jgi:hypothetical protein
MVEEADLGIVKEPLERRLNGGNECEGGVLGSRWADPKLQKMLKEWVEELQEVE